MEPTQIGSTVPYILAITLLLVGAVSWLAYLLYQRRNFNKVNRDRMLLKKLGIKSVMPFRTGDGGMLYVDHENLLFIEIANFVRYKTVSGTFLEAIRENPFVYPCAQGTPESLLNKDSGIIQVITREGMRLLQEGETDKAFHQIETIPQQTTHHAMQWAISAIANLHYTIVEQMPNGEKKQLAIRDIQNALAAQKCRGHNSTMQLTMIEKQAQNLINLRPISFIGSHGTILIDPLTLRIYKNADLLGLREDQVFTIPGWINQ